MLNALKKFWINAAIYVLLVSWTLTCVFISPACFLFFTRVLKKQRPETLRKMIWYYGWSCSKIMSCFVDIKWPEQTKLPKQSIIVANHESFFDPYLVSFQPEKNICMAVRNWPFKIPFYGFYMRLAGYINVESTELDGIRKQALTALDDGATLMFFPEGTRSRNGELSRFHSGPFHLAIETGLPIVPLCLSGTYKLLPRNKMILSPSRVRGKILPPIYPHEYKNAKNPHIELRRAVKKIMVSELIGLREDHKK